MVRMMALINIKRFLNIAEIADYLNNHGENYDMNESYDRNRLNTTIMDLVFEHRLTPLFFYSGNIKADLQKSEAVGNEPWEIAITEQKHLNQQFNDYLKITDFQIIKELMGSNYDNYVNIQQLGGFDFYKLPYEIDKEEWFYYFLEISKDFSISFYDLRFPRMDLDKIFNIPDTQELQQANLLLNTRIEKATQVYFENQQFITHLQTIIDSQTEQITDLESQLSQANAKIAKFEQQATQPSDTAADEPLKGIAKVNYDKDKAKAFASVVAKFLWNIDTNQQLRIGEMATQLYPLIHEFDNNALPQGNDTIKDWIRPHAPKYASKAGNTPRSQPPIILTLKK